MQDLTHSAESRALADFVRANPRLLVLSGAGISASAGIPTYRDAQGQWLGARPITHREFLTDPTRRQRYWARSALGWPAVAQARPGPAHLALARLEAAGRIGLLVTQNVDRLHQRAGSARVVDLHGRLDRAGCLSCGTTVARELLQQWLMRANPQLAGLRAEAPRPDGDADIPDTVAAAMQIPACTHCNGVLMPDVVFFGGSIPPLRVAQCMEALARADALLVVGSSLQVYSGFRFCRRAAQLGKPIALLNPGKSRADALASLRLQASAEIALPAAVEQILEDGATIAQAARAAAGHRQESRA